VPEIVIIAGPNGAGKTTFASEYLPAEPERFVFVNADEIAHEVAEGGPSQRADARAARMMIRRIDDLGNSGVDFAFETTLATLSYARKIPLWRRAGYVVSLIYLRLPNVEASIRRVRRRVAAGGHGISENVIRRRFEKSVGYLENTYKPIVDKWYICNSIEGSFTLVEFGDRT
jgi:predicted ABC-type ATPase